MQESPSNPNSTDPHSTSSQSDVTESDRAAAEATVTVSRWAIHRRMYDWMIGFAHHKNASSALFTFSFAESSFFPIPPDVLLGPMCLGRRSKSFWFAFICTVASVLGALLGYWIGVQFMDFATSMIPGISEERVNQLAAEFEARGQLYVFVAALTPIPFKLLTITAGASAMSIPIFVVACIVGRGVRFFMVAGVFYAIGPKAAPFIDKYFNLICIVFIVLLVGGIYLVKLFQ